MARLLALMLILLPSAAPGFEPVTSGDVFRQLVAGNALTRLGIRLEVHPDGQITGRGLGRPVRGEWRWEDGFFCRTLYWGEDDLGYNCQAVLQEGDRLRFVTERGAGIGADFRVR